MRLRHSKLSHFKTNRLLEQFVAGTPARTAAALIGTNKISATNFYHKLRLIIHDKLIEEASELAGEIEVDESYTRLRGHKLRRCPQRQAWQRGCWQGARVWIAEARREGVYDGSQRHQVKHLDPHHCL